MKVKAYRIGEKKSGARFAVIRKGNDFVVIQECHNYEHGRMVTTWRICQTHLRQSHRDWQAMAKAGMPFDEAEKLFNKKTIKPKAEEKLS